jgi:hypothetical protein
MDGLDSVGINHLKIEVHPGAGAIRLRRDEKRI